MKQIKRISALILALVFVLSLSTIAFAATTLDGNGEQGAFLSPDQPESQSKVLKLEKVLRVYNLDEDSVTAPTITYNYTVAPATVTDQTVTDNANKHASGESVQVPVKTGIGTITTSVSFTNSDELDAAVDGEDNAKDISLDFSGIAFTGPGVYRYTISESLADGFTYANTGVTRTTAPAGDIIRYIDVYVRPASPTPSDKTQEEPEFWDIYGFTCFNVNTSITDSNKVTAAGKTTGFTDVTTTDPASGESVTYIPDQYYTYNLTIGKTVVGDEYAKATHEFPFSLIFTNSDITKDILLDTDVDNATDFTHNAGAPTWHGVATIKSGGTIKYIGIPCGTDVEVYETNDVSGVTYKVATFVNGADTSSDNNAVSVNAAVTWGSKPDDGTAQGNSPAAYQSTKYTVDTTADTVENTANTYDVQIVNTLLTISPTGVVLRVAPFIVMLAAGVFIFLVTRRYRRREEA